MPDALKTRTLAKHMKTSVKGRNFIKRFERLRLRAYDDGYGFLTIGWGHRIYRDDPRVITEEDAERYLTNDLQIAEAPLRLLAGLELYQHEFDALASLIMNIGVGNFSKSTIRSHLIARRYDLAAAEFPKWKKSNGQVSNGLIRRRADERAMFQTATYVIK